VGEVPGVIIAESQLMQYAQINGAGLAIAAAFIAIAVIVSILQRLGMVAEYLVAAARAMVQLLAAGYILKYVFEIEKWYFMILMLAVMLAIAAWTGYGRLKKQKFPGALRILIASMGLGLVLTIVPILWFILKADPWYRGQYIVPISSMIMANTLTGVTLTMNRLVSELREKRAGIEAALALGATARQAISPVFRESVRTAMIPTINSMMVVGLVHFPGMMTGQMVAGASPVEAAKYQIMINYSLACSVALGCVFAAFFTYRRFFTRSHRLVEE
jgi:putative ABC transport system permease protein